MFQTKTLLTVTTLLSLPFAAAAQFTINPPINPGLVITPIPPALPPAESKFGEYDLNIGNSWLGGGVHAYAGMVRQRSGSYDLGNEHLELWAGGSLLNQSGEVMEIYGDATNIVNSGVQKRVGSLRVDVLGVPVINSNFTTGISHSKPLENYNLFPKNITGFISLAGPVGVTAEGNAGCGFGRSVSWTMATGKADVVLSASGTANAFFDAWVGIGIPQVVGAGVGISGKVLEQSLSANATASAGTGLSGGASYGLKAISIRLYAWGQLLFKVTKTLTTWSAGAVSKTLM